MKNFYQNIFNKQTVKDGDKGIDDFLKSDGDTDPYEELVKRQLSNETRDSLEGKISLHEMTKALNEDMNGTSAPGVDGFTVNFIRKFWTTLGALVVNAVNTSKSKGKLTITLRTAIFKLLRKGEKDPTLATNFRPISLLSGFYKLASCVITNRLKAYVPNDNIGSVLINLQCNANL